MKKLFIASLLIAFITTSSFATENSKVNHNILRNFKIEFSNANNVSWTVKENFVKASFVYNNEATEAFYELNGDMIGVSHKVALDLIPVSAKRALAKRYADHTITEAIRFDGPTETAYFISAENDNQKVILKVSDAGTSIFQKTLK